MGTGGRVDRFGERIEDGGQPPGEHLCLDGWIGEDADGRPRPCPTCRPHLARPTPDRGYRLARPMKERQST